jgi:membrane-associated phospholipid phosphatase
MSGNSGNTGNTGTAGLLGPGGDIASPDRMELPFIAERTPDRDRRDVRGLLIPRERWRDQHWSPEWRAWIALSKIPPATLAALQAITAADWRAHDEAAELAELAILAEDERADALDEIVAQDRQYANFMSEFVILLGISPGSHPRMVTLLHLAALLGVLVVMRLKERPAEGVPPRPRPSHRMPALKPPVEVPGHASYPSGHATQATLMALIAAEALPAAEREAWRPLLLTLAHRIARNREIAGLHYASDSEAGREAAGRIFGVLREMPGFEAMLEEARREWGRSDGTL